MGLIQSIYQVECVIGDCVLKVGDVVCTPCVAPCAEYSLYKGNDSVIVLRRLYEECRYCPNDAMLLPGEFNSLNFD